MLMQNISMKNYSAGMYDYSSFNTQIESLINAIVNRKRCYIQYYNAYQERYKRFHVETSKAGILLR